MVQKYSINGAGRIVAERDIYSLGGFIPKGRLGGAIKDETQLSQEGECWFSSGDITNRPDIVIKDNAYLGGFTLGTSEVRTDGITELSGNTLIPGILCWRTQKAYPLCNTFIKDSFIGVTMDVACGPEASTKAFPFGQGLYRVQSPAGTLFANMAVTPIPQNSCRGFANLIIGRGLKLYIPTGMRAQVLWGYFNESNQATYSGTYTEYNAGLSEVNNPVYKIGQIHIWKVDGKAMTPAQLEESGAKILGHVSGSVCSYCNSISVSGNYTLDNTNVYWNTDDFASATDRHAMFAGHAYNCDISLLASADVSVCGMFRNIERLEIGRLMLTGDYQNAKRDTFITASDCPLLRISPSAIGRSLLLTGDLTLRNCVVPAGFFDHNVVEGNTYENIDFSYSREFMGIQVGNRVTRASHKQGLYDLYYKATADSGNFLGRISYPNNTKNAESITEAHDTIPLDDNIVEQGSYTATIGQFYEEGKDDTVLRVRTGKPVSTSGLSLPSLPSGYVLGVAHYLDDGFKFAKSVSYPQSIDASYPFVVFVVNKDPATEKISASEFIALNLSIPVSDYTKIPEITGSAYVGAGCTVSGDVQLHGDPYVNRVFDVNEWDRGGLNTAPGLTWDVMKDRRNSDIRMTTKSIYPVNPGDIISVSGAYRILLCWFNSDQKLMSDTGWNDGPIIVPANVRYVGIALSTKPDLKFLDFPDIPIANVRFLRAFKNRRYITNELDRRSPEDILIGPDYWEQGTTAGGTADAGKTYEDLKATSGTTVRLKRPINVSPSTSISTASRFTRGHRVLDAVTKFIAGEPIASVKVASLGIVIQKDPSGAITPSEIPNSRLVLEFVPQPRIVVPYGSDTLFINGPKIRMYDNAVLSRNFSHDADIVLQGDAVMGYDFSSGDCLCSNGHSDAIIKLP